MAKPKEILNHLTIDLIISRFALLVVENSSINNKPTAIIGIQPRGVELSRKIFARLQELFPKSKIVYGELDITFQRDDVGRGEQVLIPYKTYIPFSTENMNVFLVDDVLYTGRSVRAALEAILEYGRPSQVKLMCLIDRRYNRELPIVPDYAGYIVDSRTTGEKVKVEWKENNNKVWLIEKV